MPSDPSHFERASSRPRAVEARALLAELLRLAMISQTHGNDAERTRDALEACRRAARELWDDQGWITLRVDSWSLSIAGVTISLSDPKALRLHSHLAPLGIAEIALHRDSDDSELHALFSKLAQAAGQATHPAARELTKQTGRSKSLRLEWRAPDDALPSTQTSRQMRSLLREAAERLSSDVPDHANDRSQLARKTLQEVLQDAATQAHDMPLSAHEAGVRGLEHVLELCTSAMRQNLSALLHRNFGVEELSGALRASEIAAALASDRGSMHLLLEVLHEAWPTLGQDRETTQKPQHWLAQPKDVQRLTAALEAHAVRPAQLRFDPNELRAETASILMHFLGDEQPQPHILSALQRRLRTVIQPPLPLEVFELLNRALHCAVREGRDREIERSLPVLLESLHHTSSRMAWEFLIRALETAESPAAQALLSPHVVAWLERNGGPTAASHVTRLGALLSQPHIRAAVEAQRKSNA